MSAQCGRWLLAAHVLQTVFVGDVVNCEQAVQLMQESMVDSGFAVPADRRDRFGACIGVDPTTGERTVYDPAEGQ